MEGKVTWTPAQWEAIHAENEKLLVSASAGTGKTEVLTERILDMVVNRKFSLDRMIIVTFTKAAAAEMRGRITAKLREAVLGDPRLQAQLDMAPLAQISTIDALCQKIVRTHFEAADIDPNFSVCQGTDYEEIKAEALNEAMEAFYEEAKENGDEAALAAKYDDKSIQLMTQKLNAFLNSLPDPEEWTGKHLGRVYSAEDFWQEDFAKAIAAQAERKIRTASDQHDHVAEMLERGQIDDHFADNIDQDGKILEELRAAAEEGALRLRDALKAGIKFPTKARVKKEEVVDGAELFDTQRKNYKKDVKTAAEIMALDAKTMTEDLNEMQPALRGLVRVVNLYQTKLWEKLSRRRQAGFADIQRLALKILRDPALQADFAGSYDAVFVDECQDVSPMQEELLSLLNRPGSCSFWVGDVKQSIYRFRQADASLFMRKMKDYSIAGGAKERLLYLSENFRSRSAIHRAVNRVFAHVMREAVTEIEYTDDAALTTTWPTTGDVPVEIHMMDKAPLEDAHESSAAVEIFWVAQDIKRRVEGGERLPNRDGTPGEPLRYGDVMILSPTKQDVMPQMERILREVGVPCMVSDGVDANRSMEIRQILSFLEYLIDERNDIALLSALRSPLLRFDERELAQIRMCLQGKDVRFREAFEEAAASAAEPLRLKCEATLSLLERERQMASHTGLCPYLWGLLQRTGYYYYVATQEGGAQRQANLEYLCDMAADWDRSHDEGLAEFVRVLRKAAEESGGGNGANPAVNRPGENAVQLMTIHKSKGLGARVVYVVLMDKEVRRTQNDVSWLSFHKNVGLTLEYRSEAERIKRKTAIGRAVQALEENAQRAEKARLLYVAMTRAKEKLVLVGCADLGGDAEALLNKAWNEKNMAGVDNASAYQDWLLQAVDDTDEIIERWDEISTAFPQDEENINRESTGSPQDFHGFRYVFHMKPTMPKEWLKEQSNVVDNTTENALSVFHSGKPEEQIIGFEAQDVENQADPLLPKLEEKPALHKIGVTSLLQFEAENRRIPWGQDETPEETRETKRLPLFPRKGREWQEEAPVPECLTEEDSDGNFSAAERGTLTHLVLELLDLEKLREAVDLVTEVRVQLRCMVVRRQLTQEEAEQVNIGQVADFFATDLGKRILNALVVRRELGFTLRVEEPPRTLVQGIIDLCFVEPGSTDWVLVDFKTDRVERPEELVERYRRQVEYYRNALEIGTGQKVREVYLYSLRLREAVKVE